MQARKALPGAPAVRGARRTLLQCLGLDTVGLCVLRAAAAAAPVSWIDIPGPTVTASWYRERDFSPSCQNPPFFSSTHPSDSCFGNPRTAPKVSGDTRLPRPILTSRPPDLL